MSDEKPRRGRPPKLPDPVRGPDGEAFARIADYFRANFPAQWEVLRFCPLESGLADMAALLDGKEVEGL